MRLFRRGKSDRLLGHKAVFQKSQQTLDLLTHTQEYKKAIYGSFTESHFKSQTFLEIVKEFFEALFSSKPFKDLNKQEIQLIPISPLTLLTDPHVFKDKFHAQQKQTKATEQQEELY